MSGRDGSPWRKYVPDVSGNPVTLAWRLLTNDNPAARSALLMAASGVALAPLDALLAGKERTLLANAGPPAMPIVLVCGPPRSGTTLVAQYLINRLQTSYVNNLASLFPQAPLTANRLFRSLTRPSSGSYDAFYGRSRGLSGVNDGLFVWDRWLGADRAGIPERLSADAATNLPQFFGALQAQTGLPIVNKVNRLFPCAALIAPLLPSATFVCLRRDPVMLAQSLLEARDRITGDRSMPYGLRHPDPVNDEPLEDVCRQVEYYERHIDAQQRLLGPDRFIVLRYERFCASPVALIDKLVESSDGGLSVRAGLDDDTRFDVSNARRLPETDFDFLERRLRRGGDA